MMKKKNIKSKNKYKKIFKITFIILFCLFFVVGLALFCKYYPTLKKCKTEADEIISHISIEDFKKNATSHVFDLQGNELFELKNDIDLEYVSEKDIPDDIKNAFIAVEDKNFYNHNGIDYKSILRASVAYLKNNGVITQGGSTITQQLTKLTYLTTEQKIDRKIKEIFISKHLEKMFTKNQILEFYINNIYFNNNAYGISAASHLYFHKELNDLSLGEITFLCAIPNNPTLFDPYTNKENTIKRQHLILQDMLSEGYINQEEYNNALSENIEVYPPTIIEKVTSYDTKKDFVKKEVAEIIMKKNNFNFKYNFKTLEEKEQYNKDYLDAYNNALNKLYKSGFNIYTSFDTSLEKEVQLIIDNYFKGEQELTNSNIYALQCASTIIENKTGLIQTMIGGRTSPEVDYLNRAYNSYRQNGSTMKPIGVYGPAFDLLNYNPNTIINDSYIQNGPKNSSGYYGDITIRKALTISSNTAAYKIFEKVTPEKGIAYLQNMEFKNIVPNDFTLSAGLGGLTIGTNTNEMASAYATIENKGLFNPAKCIVEIKEINSGVTYYKHKNLNKKIYEESSAELLTDILKDVLISGTARGKQLDNNIDCAGKTGTTDDNKDAWFCGFSPKYTTSIWVGYDTPRVMTKVYNTIIPSEIWRQVMNLCHKNDKDLKFDEYKSIKKVFLNYKGEEIPYNQGISEYFAINKMPSKNKELFTSYYKNIYTPKLQELCNKYTIKTEEDLNNFNEEMDKLLEEINNSDIFDDLKEEYYTMITKNKELAKKRFLNPSFIEENNQLDENINKEEKEEKEEINENNDTSKNNLPTPIEGQLFDEDKQQFKENKQVATPIEDFPIKSKIQ